MLKRVDYKHKICIFITIAFIDLVVLYFLSSYARLFESFLDFISSMKCYFEFLILGNEDCTSSVTEYSKVLDLTTFLPNDFELFKQKLFIFWQLFFDKNNFIDFVITKTESLSIILKVIILILPLILVGFLVLKRIYRKQNNDYNKKSKPLVIYQKYIEKPFNVVVNYIKHFISFLKDTKVYLIIWAILWALNFNLVTIVIEFFAFYFYFVVSFDFIHIYVQIVKLFIDLSIIFKVVPVPIWLILAYIIFDKIRKSIALSRLRHFENKNRAFISSKPLVTMTNGTMGTEKTTEVCDMVLSTCAMHKDKALEKLLENDMKFPNFPWINLEKVLQGAMDKHIVFNLATTRQFIVKLKANYEKYGNYNLATRKAILRHFRKVNDNSLTYLFNNFMFDYDYEKYGTTFDNKLYVANIWDIIETYAQLYFIYLIESSFIFSNFSIRTDNILLDKGNFPIWDNDFFTRNSKEIDKISKYAHILDYDCLRLGKKVIENNKYANAFEFGIIAITEIGKERGNMQENLDKKKTDDIANSKNDGFNDELKMIRHSATVDNYPFVRIICDEQRCQSLGADARELCDLLRNVERKENRLAMPFFNLGEIVHTIFYNKFTDKYVNYRFNRGDNTLFMYLYKGISSKLHNRYIRLYNQYGFHVLKVQTESGLLDGNINISDYYIMDKKAYSKRFMTDCHGDFYNQKSLKSNVGINDLPTYKGVKATFEELKQQNSYFIHNLMGIQERDK